MDQSVCVQVMLLLSFLIMHHMSAQDLDEHVLLDKFHCFVSFHEGVTHPRGGEKGDSRARGKPVPHHTKRCSAT